MRARCSVGMPELVSAISATTRASSAPREQPPAVGTRGVFKKQVQKYPLKLMSILTTGTATPSERRILMLPTRIDARAARTSVMTLFRSTRPVRFLLWRDKLSRLFTILAARNVCRLIFPEQHVLIGRVGALPHLGKARNARQWGVDLVRDACGQQPTTPFLGNWSCSSRARSVMSSIRRMAPVTISPSSPAAEQPPPDE